HHRTYGSVLLTHRLPRVPSDTPPRVPTLLGRAVGNHTFKGISKRMYSVKLCTRKKLSARVRPTRGNSELRLPAERIVTRFGRGTRQSRWRRSRRAGNGRAGSPRRRFRETCGSRPMRG